MEEYIHNVEEGVAINTVHAVPGKYGTITGGGGAGATKHGVPGTAAAGGAGGGGGNPAALDYISNTTQKQVVLPRDTVIVMLI